MNLSMEWIRLFFPEGLGEAMSLSDPSVPQFPSLILPVFGFHLHHLPGLGEFLTSVPGETGAERSQLLSLVAVDVHVLVEIHVLKIMIKCIS